jgi:hypothetical protein
LSHNATYIYIYDISHTYIYQLLPNYNQYENPTDKAIGLKVNDALKAINQLRQVGIVGFEGRLTIW